MSSRMFCRRQPVFVLTNIDQNLTQSPFSRADLFSLEKGGVFLLLTADKKNVIQLRDVAFDIWKFIDKPKTMEEIVEHISNLYDERKEVIAKDVKQWLNEACKEGIVLKN